MNRSGTSRSAFCLVVLAIVGSAAAQIPTMGGCDASFSVDLEHEEDNGSQTELQFRVEISTTAPCAKIVYDLIIEEILPNGQSKRIRKPRDVKLNDGTEDELVRHVMPAGSSLSSYEAKLVECTPCELTP